MLLGLVLVFFLFLLWYQYRYSMEVVAPYEVNSPDMPGKVLIATQGSDFKDIITNAVVSQLRSDSIYISVIDVTSLAAVDPRNFDGILIMHTWENWKPPAEVRSFIERTRNDSAKIVVLSTSGEGSYKMEGVDALTGESVIEGAPVFTERIMEKLYPLLRNSQ
jgi:hypothetical protein